MDILPSLPVLEVEQIKGHVILLVYSVVCSGTCGLTDEVLGTPMYDFMSKDPGVGFLLTKCPLPHPGSLDMNPPFSKRS